MAIKNFDLLKFYNYLFFNFYYELIFDLFFNNWHEFSIYFILILKPIFAKNKRNCHLSSSIKLRWWKMFASLENNLFWMSEVRYVKFQIPTPWRLIKLLNLGRRNFCFYVFNKKLKVEYADSTREKNLSKKLKIHWNDIEIFLVMTVLLYRYSTTFENLVWFGLIWLKNWFIFSNFLDYCNNCI